MMLPFLRHNLVVRPLICALVPVLLSSCSAWIPHNAKVHLSDPSSADALKGFDTFGESVPVNGNIIRCSNRQRFYTVERTKKGYLPAYTTLHQNGVNPMLAIDGGLALIGAGMMVSSGGNKDDYSSSTSSNGGSSTVEVLGPTLLGYGLLGVLVGKKKSFKNAAGMDPMIQLPTHGMDQMFVYVDKVSLKLESGKVDTRNFKSLPNYRNNLTETGEMKEKRKVTTTFDVDNVEKIDLSKELNDILVETGFIDTNSVMFRMSHNSNLLEAEVTHWGYNYIYGGAYSFQITTKWSMKDNLSKQVILERSYTSASDVIVDDSDNDLYRKGFVNALMKSLMDLMEEPAFKDAMVDKRQKFQSTMDGWAPIVAKTGKYDKQKLSESSKSVATVKTKEGHGSGVFISNDGLLITNLHVTGQQAEGLEIMLADGKKLTGKVERSNPVYDLALVRVEGYAGKAMAVSMLREIELGEPVFAIGTPTDISLGQTLTKGIISSKRVFSDLDYIQTDVSISGGNSGGALLNETGQLIGVVNAKIIGDGVEGVGFAIPSYYIPEALKLTLQ